MKNDAKRAEGRREGENEGGREGGKKDEDITVKRNARREEVDFDEEEREELQRSERREAER